MKASVTLGQVREQIGTPDKWTKGANARNACGKTVPFNDATASCWCVLGGFPPGCDTYRPMRYLEKAVGENIINFNDHPNTKHEDVLSAIDRAIGLALRESD